MLCFFLCSGRLSVGIGRDGVLLVSRIMVFARVFARGLRWSCNMPETNLFHVWLLSAKPLKVISDSGANRNFKRVYALF